eukprot:4267045-Pyramimonas_sp.AAC.1
MSFPWGSEIYAQTCLRRKGIRTRCFSICSASGDPRRARDRQKQLRMKSWSWGMGRDLRTSTLGRCADHGE